MKPEELKIGNLVEYNGFVMTVCGIYPPKPLEDKRYSDKWLVEITDGSLLTVPLYELKGIQLTHKWLERMQSEKIVKNRYVIDRFRLRYLPEYHYWYVTDLDHNYITKVEYVHEWQNVYRFLNGEEIEIK